MKGEQKAYITLYLTLVLGVLLSLVFVLLEGIRDKTMRTEVESVMDIGLYSVFGEYHRQLLEQYDLFFIDTSYGEGAPNIKRSEEHLQYYMNENFQKEGIQTIFGFRDLTNLNCDNVEFENYVYATDEQGGVVKSQIVDYMQDKNGTDRIENLLKEFLILKRNNMSINISEKWNEADETLSGLLAEKKKEMIDPETGEPVPIAWDNPADQIKELKAQGTLGFVLPKETEISSMVIHPEYYVSHRNLFHGQGTLNFPKSLLDKTTENLLLQQYFTEKCGSFLSEKKNGVLKYQIEYMLAGRESDIENLESVVEDILHIREGINFAYLISDKEKVAEAEALAWMVSALLFSPEIKEVVKMTIMYAWTYAESVKDVRILLDGNKLPLLKTFATWNTPLSQLFMFASYLDRYEESSTGMTYRDYLHFLLSIKEEKVLLYRFMDLCEMDIRITEGNQYFQMDGCISAVKATANISSGYGNGYRISRRYAYE